MTRVPEKPPALAVIVALPTATPVTVPVDAPTEATAVLDEVHAIVALTAVPDEFRAAAESVTEAPTATDVVLPEIETLAMVWLVVPVVLPPGDVGLLLPPPPQAVMLRLSETVNADATRLVRARIRLANPVGEVRVVCT
jgi:hypothetical protein